MSLQKIEALKQLLSHIEEVEVELTFKFKQLKWKSKNFPSENPFDFTENVKKQKEENEIDLGLFFELAEEN